MEEFLYGRIAMYEHILAIPIILPADSSHHDRARSFKRGMSGRDLRRISFSRDIKVADVLEGLTGTGHVAVNSDTNYFVVTPEGLEDLARLRERAKIEDS